MTKTADLARKSIYNTQLKHYVDLNTDFGQSRDKAFFEATEHQLLTYVSSVNIPCCVHDGDPLEVIEAIQRAQSFHCGIGAHIGYPDPAHGGYQPMDISPEELAAWTHVQLGAFLALAKSVNATVQHVRPHGALYQAFATNPKIAMAVAEVIYRTNPWLILLAPAGPVLEEIRTKLNMRVAPEIYLGKRYLANGSIDERDLKDPGFHVPPQGVFEQAKQAIQQNTLTSAQGKPVAVKFKSLHISPALNNPQQLAERLCNILGQPVALNLSDVGASGWL